jgi:RNA polymerase sigma-70 factor, ECF subfamily
MAQNALVRAWRNQHKLIDRNRKKEWISQIARNEALRERDRRVPDPVDDPDLGAEEDSELIALVEGSSVWDALASLSEQDRQLLALRYEGDMTQSAIAEHLGIPEGTVKVRLYRARNKLRDKAGIQ